MLPDDPLGRLRHYAKHLVGLHCVDGPSNNNGRKKYGDIDTFTVSGFILSIQNQWFWLTAGHICDDLEHRLQDGRELLKCRLIDLWAHPGQNDGGIPLPYQSIPRITDKDRDYGYLPLRPSIRRLLEANGVLALDETKWKNLPETMDGFEMVGLPTETTKNTISKTATHKYIESRISPHMAPIRHERDLPDGLATDFPRFYGTLIDIVDGKPNGQHLKSIDGLSGSPIFGVKRADTGELDYWLIAIQSGWISNRRLIFGCFAYDLAQAISSVIDRQKI